MRVLLTGANGFLGRYVLASFARHSIDVVVIGRSCPEGYTGEFLMADLFDRSGPPDLRHLRVTHMVHLAWYAEHGRFWTSAENVKWVAATEYLVRAFCEAGGERVVVAGSCAEYDWSNGLCREDETPLAPASIYGLAKNLARGLVAAICSEYAVSWAWGRIFIPFGAGENRSRLLPSLMDVFAGTRAPFAVGLRNERDFVHAHDVAEAFVHLLAPTPYQCYNISSGQPMLIRDVVRMVAAIYKRNPDIVAGISTESEDASCVVGANERLLALGWRPTKTLTDTLGMGRAW